MAAVVIIGAQWGDEGKGKVVDLLSERADVVVRYAGGPNAGHTLVVGEDRIVFRLVPSGVLHERVRCILGPGMVIDPEVLLDELDTLSARGVPHEGRIVVADRAHLILPYHVAIDGLREASSRGTRIGTTKRGIGPCYEDKAGRRGVRTGDLRDLQHARRRIVEALAAWEPTASALGAELPSADEVLEPLARMAPRILPLLTDAPAMVDREVRANKAVMLEGAQGTMLDVDHGTYPYVTSSSAIAGGACTGAGLGPSRVDRVVGITKAYTTRVGEGPFPSELDDAAGAHLRDVGGEFGSVTGRPRRTGWLDLVGLRYAARVNGLDGLAVTKLDVLTGLETIGVCVGYRTAEGESDVVPTTGLDALTPIYERLEGWDEDISGCRSFDELPAAAARYLRFVEERAGVGVDVISVGPRREQTIVMRDPFA